MRLILALLLPGCNFYHRQAYFRHHLLTVAAHAHRLDSRRHLVGVCPEPI